MFGLLRQSSKEKSPRLSVSQTSFKYSLNTFDEFVSVQEQPNRRNKEYGKSSKRESDPKRRLVHFDVQEICDNFVKGVDKALKDVNRIHKKSPSTRAPVAEPCFFISKKTQGESENNVEKLKDFSDSLPIFDEYDKKLMKGLITCEDKCDLPSLEPDLVFKIANEESNGLTCFEPELPSSLVLSSQEFEEEPFNHPHHGRLPGTMTPLHDDFDPIFDEEDEPGPVFDEEATMITSIAMESHNCFDPGTALVPLSPDLQEHCENISLINSLPDMFVKVSSHDVIRFGLDKMKEFCVSKSVFETMFNSFQIFKPDELLDQQRFQNVKGINSGIILSFDQFLEHNKDFHCLEKSLELELQQTDFCPTKSFDSFVFKRDGSDLSSYKHSLITGGVFAPPLVLGEILTKQLLENKLLETENDFCDLDLCDFILQSDLLSPETDRTWHFLRSFRVHCFVLSLDDIVVYNTFFEKHLESLIFDSQSELKLVCSDVEKDRHVLKITNVAACLDTILVYNVYFDVHLDQLKLVLLVHENKILIFELNKYLSCTYDPGLLVSVLSIQERRVQPLRNERIDLNQQPEIWSCTVVQSGYLGDASDRGSVQGEYLDFQKVFYHESNFPGRPTHQGFTEVWNHMKRFADEGVMNFPNRRFSSPSIREYQISQGDLGPEKNWPETKPIIGFQMDLSAFQKDQYQEKWPRNYEVMIYFSKPVKPVLHLPHLEANRFSQLQTRHWRPGDKSIHSGSFSPNFFFIEFYMFLKFFLSDSFSFESGKMDLRTNPFEEGEYDVPQIELIELNTLVSWTDTILDDMRRTDTHLDKLSKLVQSSELVRPPDHPRSNKDIHSLFEAYLLNHDVSSRETACIMFST